MTAPLYPAVTVPHPGQPNDLWEWAKASARALREDAPPHVVAAFLNNTMQGYFDGQDAALAVARTYLTVEEKA